jgi:hypothetical protein
MVSNTPAPTAESHTTNDAPASSGAAKGKIVFAVAPDGEWVRRLIGAFSS